MVIHSWQCLSTKAADDTELRESPVRNRPVAWETESRLDPGSVAAESRGKESTLDYLEFYDLEEYLLSEVRRRFHANGSLSAFDFFLIVASSAGSVG